MLAQLSLRKHPDLPDTPLIADYAKTDEARIALCGRLMMDDKLLMDRCILLLQLVFRIIVSTIWQPRSLSISLSRQNDPIVVALRTGAPQRVDDVAVDDRLEPDERDLLITMRVGRFVAASLPTTTRPLPSRAAPSLPTGPSTGAAASTMTTTRP